MKCWPHSYWRPQRVQGIGATRAGHDQCRVAAEALQGSRPTVDLPDDADPQVGGVDLRHDLLAIVQDAKEAPTDCPAIR